MWENQTPTHFHNSLVHFSCTLSYRDIQIHHQNCCNLYEAWYYSHQCPLYIHQHLFHTGYQSRLLDTYKHQLSSHMTGQDQWYVQQYNHMCLCSCSRICLQGKLKIIFFKILFNTSHSWLNLGRQNIESFVFLFSQKTGFDISCKLSPMKYQLLFSGKNKDICRLLN